jgi:hypothetical protein
MRRSPVRSSRLEASNRIRSLVDFITITSGSRFSVRTISTICLWRHFVVRLNELLSAIQTLRAGP